MKVVITEIQNKYVTNPETNKSDTILTEVPLHTLESNDKKVIASFLRGVADTYDPSKSNTRGYDA